MSKFLTPTGTKNLWLGFILVILCGLLLVPVTSAASTPIYGPTVITEPGSYYLASSIVNSTEPVAILIQCSNVVLDGKSKTIDGTDQAESVGIKVYNAAMTLVNVVVKNVICTDWATGVFINDVKNSVFEKITAKSNTEDGILVGHSTDNSFNKLTAIDNGRVGLLLYDGSNLNTISNVLSQNNGDDGIRLRYSNGNVVQKSKILGNKYQGIDLFQSNHNTITQNTITANGANAIYLNDECNLNIITKNTATGHLTTTAIPVSNSDYNEISSNTIKDNMYGIYLYAGSENNIISNNILQNNSMDGLYLNDDANDNLVYGNTIKQNAGTGLTLNGVDDNVIFGNYVRENKIQGVNIAGNAKDNVIFNNYFYNTNNTKFVTTSANTWNLTYGNVKSITGGKYSGGNSWGQPNGQGFSQVTPDSNGDGICDSAYAMATNNIDKLPLKYKRK